MIKNEKMKLEDARHELQKTIELNNEVIKEARKNGDINVMQLTADLDNQSIAIETVLQELNNLQEKNKTLIEYIGTQGLISDYLRYKSIRNRRCK